MRLRMTLLQSISTTFSDAGPITAHHYPKASWKMTACSAGVFLLIGTHIKRQFEFVQSQWVTDGDFIRQGTEQDPILGNSQGDGIFTIPKRPVRRRLHGLPQFIT